MPAWTRSPPLSTAAWTCHAERVHGLCRREHTPPRRAPPSARPCASPWASPRAWVRQAPSRSAPRAAPPLIATSVSSDMVDRLEAAYIAGAVAATPGAGANVYVLDAHLAAGDGDPHRDRGRLPVGGRTRARGAHVGRDGRGARRHRPRAQRARDGRGRQRDALRRGRRPSARRTPRRLCGGTRPRHVAADVPPPPRRPHPPRPTSPSHQPAPTASQPSPDTSAPGIPHLDSFEEMLAKINALNDAYADDTAHTADTTGEGAPRDAATPAGAKDAMAAPRFSPTGARLATSRNTAIRAASPARSSTRTTSPSRRCTTRPCPRWRGAWCTGSPTTNATSSSPTSTPAALRDNTAVMWDGAHPPLVFKPLSDRRGRTYHRFPRGNPPRICHPTPTKGRPWQEDSKQ